MQFEAFRIDADAAPVSVPRSKQLRCIKPACIGVVGIHVIDGIRLGIDERPGIGNVSKDIARSEIDEAEWRAAEQFMLAMSITNEKIQTVRRNVLDTPAVPET